MEDWDGFLAPYQQTVAELKMKLKGIRTQFKLEGKHSPIEFVTGRVKPIESIVDKALKNTFQSHDLPKRSRILLVVVLCVNL